MNVTAASTSHGETQIVDIQEVFPKKEDGEQDVEMTRIGKRGEKRPRPMKFREQKRAQNSFCRQVSLETGFSVLNGESKAKDESKVFRSQKSFGGFSFANGGNAEDRKRDFNLFRTKSTLGKQNPNLSFMRQKSDLNLQGPEANNRHDQESVNQTVPVGRYFAALKGPELDQVKDSEDILLPKDEKWPFLLRFPISCFGICLGLSSQAILWLNLATSSATKFLHITPFINLGLWVLAVSMLLGISIIYALKFTFYFEAVRREYYHPVRVNFFFAPWVVCMFLAIGAPPILAPKTLHPAVWCVLMGPVFFLELKIYGQWLSGGRRRLCKVANPSTHLSVVGNFVGAILAAKVGWKEPAKFLWAIGFAHYLVVFVTLYQRLPTSEALPKELHPVYSMFIAAPSAASIAWGSMYGEFDGCSRTCYFIALFLYISLIARLNFFWGFRFSVAWWSYTFPMTTASIATIKYAEQVPCTLSKGLALALSFMSSTVVCVLFVSTLLHAFVWQTLFPNDFAIAITKKRQEKEKKPFKKSYDLRRWTKQAPLSIASAVANGNSVKKGSQLERKSSGTQIS